MVNYQDLYERFKLYFPNMIDQVDSWKYLGFEALELISNGSVYDYYDYTTSIRKVGNVGIYDDLSVNTCIRSRLQNIILVRGESQKDMYKHLGISQQTFSNYITGKRKMSISFLKNISEYFNVRIDDLIF